MIGNKSIVSQSRWRSESGATILLVAAMAAMLVGLAALATDISLARREQRAIQAAADAGVLAGALKLMNGENDTAATTEATQIALSNVPNATLETVQVGHWDSATSAFSNIGSHNAVRIQAVRTVATRFASVWNAFSLSPRVEAVASFGGADSATCMIPFGLSSSLMQGKHYGDTISISRPSPGNWGKLDVGGINSSSGPVFFDNMQSGMCGTVLKVGDTVSPGTGYAQLTPAFEERLDNNPIVTMPIIQAFGNGNSPVTVVGFIVAELLTQGNSGSNWNGEIRFLREETGLGASGSVGQPYAMNRVLSR